MTEHLNQAQTTKLEHVTEAIEDLIVQASRQYHGGGGCFADMLDARAELYRALKALLTPTLRVVGNEPQGCADDDTIFCPRCGGRSSCGVNCHWWASAVRCVTGTQGGGDAA